MKKISTLFLGLIIALSAVAAPQLSKRDAGKQIKSQNVTLENVQYSRVTTPVVKSTAAVVRAPKAKAEYNNSPSDAQAMLYSDEWTLGFYAGKSYVGEVSFKALAEDKIAGTYEVTGYAVYEAGDTVEVAGTAQLAALRAGAESTVYSIAIDTKDSIDRVWKFTDEFEVIAIDYIMYFTYMMGYADYEEIFIDLNDLEIVPTGDTVRYAFTLPASLVDASAGDAYGDKWIQATDEDANYYFSVCLNTDHLVGSYTYEDFDAKYTALYDVATEKEIKLDSLIRCDISESGDTVILVTEVLGKDGVVYIMTQKCFTPAVEKEVNLEISGCALDDTYLDYGLAIFGGKDASTMISLAVYVEDGIVGTYTAEDIYSKYTGIQIGQDYIYIYEISNIVVEAEGKGYLVTADVLAKDGTLYHVKMHVVAPEGVENTNAAVKAEKVLRNGQLFIIKNGVEYNALGTIVK